MRFSELAKAAPADVPAGSIQLRGNSVEIYRLTSRDVFRLLASAPGVVEAWGDEEDGATGRLLTAVGKAGPEVLDVLFASGLRSTPAEIKGAALDLEEEADILAAILEHSIPEGILEKLLAGLQKLESKAGVSARES
jgi:hypothetical protein